MKEGKAVESFTLKGKGGEKLTVAFRYPSVGDAEKAMRLINSIRDETDFLGKRYHETMESEREFISKRIEDMKKKRGVFLFVEVNGEIAGNSIIEPLPQDASSHVGRFGIALREKYTGIGIGTRLMGKMIELGRKNTRYKMLDSGHFSKNERSKKLHKRFGFKPYGRFPKECKLRDGTYDDHIYVYKVIKKL